MKGNEKLSRWERKTPEVKPQSKKRDAAFCYKKKDKLIERDIEPFVTLYHFDLPFKLVEKYNGWE
ncbi:family 1 glycosylhydrolase, partial [Clostridioides difficile]|nr:family 1 glycosylhydrolase [Clostridioides difficile]